jgi:hypothetical protein
MVKRAQLSLRIINYHAMKTYGEWRYGPAILDLGNRRRWTASLTLRLIWNRGSAPSTRLMKRWLTPRAGLDAVECRQIFGIYRESKLDLRTLLYRLSYSGSLLENWCRLEYILFCRLLPSSSLAWVSALLLRRTGKIIMQNSLVSCAFKYWRKV